MEKKRFGVGLVIACVLALGFSPWVMAEDPPEPVQVPDVLELTEAAARTAIGNAGLVVWEDDDGQINGVYTDYAPAGIIVEQIPAGGEWVYPGSTVFLTKSLGLGDPPVEDVAVPDLMNLQDIDVSAVLATLGLVAHFYEDQSDTVPAGRVMGQSPAPTTVVTTPVCTEMEENGHYYWLCTPYVVDVTISSGPYPPVEVPDLLGLTQAQANTALTALVLQLGDVRTRCEDDVDAGLVSRQNIPEGALVPRHTAVNITVSLGPCETCDPAIDPDRVLYTPEGLSPNTLNAVLNLLTAVPLKDTIVESQTGWVNVTIQIDLDTVWDMSAANFLIEADEGWVQVSLNLPAFDTVMYSRILGPITGVGGGIARDAMMARFNLRPLEFGWDYLKIWQEADVCVTANCDPIFPGRRVGGRVTQSDVAGTYMLFGNPPQVPYLPPCVNHGYVVGTICYDELVLGALDFGEILGDALETEDGKAMLLEIFNTDITTDGCLPLKEVIECLEGPDYGDCHVVGQARNTMARSANTLFYLLPVVVMVGLITWRRRRK